MPRSPKPLRITTWNVAGLRAALRKNALAHLDRLGADILLLQEVRALPEQLDESAIAALQSRYPHITWHPAVRKGYSGVATLSKAEPTEIRFGLARSKQRESDDEGRLIVSRFDLEAAKLRIANLYLPSGSSGDHRQAVKDQWLIDIVPFAKSMARSPIPTIIMGDLNVAHDERDIYYAKSNEKTSGYLPHERAWFRTMTTPAKSRGVGLHDTLRNHAGDRPGPYTWWSNRGEARAKDRGWRIDHALANHAANKHILEVTVDRRAALESSDHAPVTVVFAP